MEQATTEARLQYDPERVIEKLSRRLADAEASLARTESVAETLLAERNTLADALNSAQEKAQKPQADTNGPTVTT